MLVNELMYRIVTSVIAFGYVWGDKRSLFFILHLIVGFPICVFLYIRHHTVMHHHIEKHGNQTANCAQKRIRVTAS